MHHLSLVVREHWSWHCTGKSKYFGGPETQSNKESQCSFAILTFGNLAFGLFIILSLCLIKETLIQSFIACVWPQHFTYSLSLLFPIKEGVIWEANNVAKFTLKVSFIKGKIVWFNINRGDWPILKAHPWYYKAIQLKTATKKQNGTQDWPGVLSQLWPDHPVGSKVQAQSRQICDRWPPWK